MQENIEYSTKVAYNTGRQYKAEYIKPTIDVATYNTADLIKAEQDYLIKSK